MTKTHLTALNDLAEIHRTQQLRIDQLEQDNQQLEGELEELREKIGDIWATTPGCGEAGVSTPERLEEIARYIEDTRQPDEAFERYANRLTKIQGSLNNLMIDEFHNDPAQAQRIEPTDKLDMIASRLEWRRGQLARAYRAVEPDAEYPPDDPHLEVMGNYIVSGAASLLRRARNVDTIIEQRDRARRQLRHHEETAKEIYDRYIGSSDDTDMTPERILDGLAARLSVTQTSHKKLKDLGFAYAGGEWNANADHLYNVLAGKLQLAKLHRQVLEQACAEVGLTIDNPDLQHQLLHSIRLGKEAMAQLDRVLVNTVDPGDVDDRDTACDRLIDQWNAYQEVLHKHDINQSNEHDSPQEALEMRLDRLTELETLIKNNIPTTKRLIDRIDAEL